ncbi:MAG: hypothetical protein ACK5PF_09370 [bacterium]
MTDDLVARARAAQRDGHRIEARTARAEAAEADAARLREALKPFATVLKDNWFRQRDGLKIRCGTNEFDLRLDLTLGDFRKALAALKGQQP